MGETNLTNVPPLSDSMQWTNDTTPIVAYISLRMQRVLPVCRVVRVTVGTTAHDNVSRPFGSVKHSKYTVHYPNLGPMQNRVEKWLSIWTDQNEWELREVGALNSLLPRSE